MDIYVGDGDVVKMKCKETGDCKNPNMHKWVLKSDADKAINNLTNKISNLEKEAEALYIDRVNSGEI